MTDKMAMGQKYGQMVRGTRVSIKMGKKMAKVFYIFLINRYTLVNLWRMKSMEGVHINGQIKEYTLVIGRKIKCMEEDKLCGLTDENTQEYKIILISEFSFIKKRNILKIKNMDRVYLNGRMAENTKDLGQMVNKKIIYFIFKGK